MNIRRRSDTTPRMPKDAPRPLSCDKAGAFLGAIPLLVRRAEPGRKRWQPRPTPELNYVLSKAYGVAADLAAKEDELAAIAAALNSGDIEEARRALSALSLPDLPDSIAKRVGADTGRFPLALRLRRAGILKAIDPAAFDPDKHPRWPAGAPDRQGGQFRATDGGNGNVAPAATHRPSGHGPRLLGIQRTFFEKLHSAAARIARRYGLNEDFVLGLAAAESHWFDDPAAIAHNNPFGINIPTNPAKNLPPTLMQFDSIDAAFDYWGEHFGSRTAGSKTPAEFIARLQAGPRGKYNSVNANYDGLVKDLIHWVRVKKPLWLREQQGER